MKPPETALLMMSRKHAQVTTRAKRCDPRGKIGIAAICALALAGCASQPAPSGAGPGNGRYFDPILGVWASPRVVADGEPVPRGGGGYLVGRPYTVGGKSFMPIANPKGYSVVGTASWYGDAFHGRRTANGEIFDKGSISAAHPTLPLPSYVRVTNLKNGWSMVVRVNDRGPYHGGRVMDVSQRVAETLDFKNAGTARIRVDYVGRAGLRGSENGKLLATLRTDGGPARLDGADDPIETAGALGPLEPLVPLVPPPLRPPLERTALIAEGRREPVAAPPDPEPPLPTPSPMPPLVPTPLAPARPLASVQPRRTQARFPVGRDPYYRPLSAPAAAGREPAPISFATPNPSPRQDRTEPVSKPSRSERRKPPRKTPGEGAVLPASGDGQP